MEETREPTPDEAYDSYSDASSNVISPQRRRSFESVEQEHAKYLSRKQQKEEHDKLKMKLKQHQFENPEKYFKTSYPLIKMVAVENLINELQHAKPEKQFETCRGKIFQIFNALLKCPDLSSRVIETCTSSISTPGSIATNNWINHPPLDEYFRTHKPDKKYDGHSLVQFLRFVRNSSVHILQGPEDLREKIIKTKHISRTAVCKFFDDRYPALLAFLCWLYVESCDKDDEILQLLGTSSSNNNRLLKKSNLVRFITINVVFFFGKSSKLTDVEVRRIVEKSLEFDNTGTFVYVKPKNEEAKENSDPKQNPKKNKEKTSKKEEIDLSPEQKVDEGGILDSLESLFCE